MPPRLVALALLAACLTSHQEAAAQSKEPFSTLRFRPAPGPSTYVGVEGTEVLPDKTKTASAFFDYATDTLVVAKPCDSIPGVSTTCRNQETAFVAKTALLQLMGSLSVGDRAQLGLALPVGVTDSEPFDTRLSSNGGASPALRIQPAEGFALGDLRLSGKYLWASARADSPRIAASGFLTLPTAALLDERDCRDAGACSYLGERGVELGARAIGELVQPRYRVAASLGLAYRPRRQLLSAKSGSELLLAVAGEYTLTPLLAAAVELEGAAGVAGQNEVPLEARAALRLGRDLRLSAGLGAGITGQVGAPTVRVIAGLTWLGVTRDDDADGLLDADDACPSEPEDRDGFLDGDGCPDPDNDEDGRPDAVDQCPNEAEDLDGFRDEDGCPDPDNDADGVPDGYDLCPDEQEDRDGDRDDDGCADLDTDRDGVMDEVDQCPDQPEDTDGLEDQDGCPEEDADGDGWPDTEDACPDEAARPGDDDGCP